jgi:hypothetical protein
MLFFFAHSLMRKHYDRLPLCVAAPLWSSADSLCKWFCLLKRSPRVMETAVCRTLKKLAKAVAVGYKETGLDPKPKFHHIFEMSVNAVRTGNPMQVSTYIDETLNSVLANHMSGSRDTYAARLLEKCEILRIARRI